jgi:hypothetical protein
MTTYYNGGQAWAKKLQFSIRPRRPVNNLVVYLDLGVDTIRHIRAWVLDPITLELNSNTVFWKSGDIVEKEISVKTLMGKLEFFIKSVVNVTGSYETLPYVVFWDQQQQKILKEYIPTLDKLVNGTVILQERCRDIFKYDLRVQGFSLQEIAEVMGIEDPKDCVKMVRIATIIEREYKSIAKVLRKS